MRSFLVCVFICLAGTVAAVSQNIPSQTPEQVLTQARRLANTGRGEDALRLLEGLSAGTPGLQDARGLALYDLDRMPAAEQAFAAALQQNPQDVEAAQMRGLTLFRMGRPADAIPWLERGEATRPQDVGAPASGFQAEAQTKAQPTYVLALCYVDTRRYDDARHAYAAQYGFPPDSASAYLLAARMLLRREYLPVAQRFATEALTLQPHLPLAHEVLGEIALAGNHVEEATAQFEKERMENPLQPSTYERLGDAYARAGQYPQARRALQQAILLEPNSTGPYILLGKVTLKEGDAVAAATYLQKAERMDPSNYMTHNLLAQSFRLLGRTDDAARELKLTEQTQAADSPKLSTVR